MGRGALSSVAKLQASFCGDFEELHWNTCWNSGQPNIFTATTFACYPESSLDAEGSHKCHAVGCLSGFVSKDWELWMEKITNPRMLCDEQQNCTERELMSEGSMRNRLSVLGLCFAGLVENQPESTESELQCFESLLVFSIWGICGWCRSGESSHTYTLSDIIPRQTPHRRTTSHVLTEVWTITYMRWAGLFRIKAVSGFIAYWPLNTMRSVSAVTSSVSANRAGGKNPRIWESQKNLSKCIVVMYMWIYGTYKYVCM